MSFPKFTLNDFNSAKIEGCSNDNCDVAFIVSKAVSSGGNGCCDCPPGPSGPPGPAGPPGPSGDSSCVKVFAGPLFPDPEEEIDPVSFESLLNTKGYMVRLNANYDAEEEGESAAFDASIITSGPGNQGYINPSTGAITAGDNPNESGNGFIYPLDKVTTSSTGNDYYSSTVSFRDFLELKSTKDSTPQASKNYLEADKTQIPSLLTGDGYNTGNYTFISKDKSAIDSVNGPYRLKKFKDLASGIVGGSIRSDEFKSDNPVSLTNLGEKIINSGGEIGADYGCEDCINVEEQNRLTDIQDVGDCDVFVDTENGVMYTRDGNWPDSSTPKFKQNGIPLRRTPVIPDPEIYPAPKPKVFAAIIKSSEPFPNPTAPSPYYKWRYRFNEVTFNSTTNSFVEKTTETSYNNSWSYNGAENNNDVYGIGRNDMFGSLPVGSLELLPIRVGTVVTMTFDAGKYIFCVPNAYKTGCAE